MENDKTDQFYISLFFGYICVKCLYFMNINLTKNLINKKY